MGRPRTFIALAVGIIAFFLLPDSLRLATRLVVGWDVFAALYLVLAYIMMLRCDVGHIRRSAVMQDDGRFLILLVTALGAFASLAAIVFELGASKGNPAGLTLAMVTIALSWAAGAHRLLRCTTRMNSTAAKSPAACSFRAATRMPMPTTGTSSTSRS